MNSKLSSEWLRALFVGWVKFFGPMTILASDQEGAITSDQVGIACEKFGIKLDLGGSYGHTAAPVAERRLALMKLCAVKLWASSQKTGLPITQDMCGRGRYGC